MRIATWNLEWPTLRRQGLARTVLEGRDADVVVTTEDRHRPWESFPYLVDAGSDWGYTSPLDHRKVMAWSRTPWRRTDVETPGATNGRLIVASTTVETEYTIVAVCIPWAAAHVSSGRADRRRWDEHLEFCELLGGVIDDLRDRGPLIVAGDFNQLVPRHRQPLDVWDALQSALRGMEIVTGGEQMDMTLIDHIAHGPAVVTKEVVAWANVVDGERLSDHAGVCVDVSAHRL